MQFLKLPHFLPGCYSHTKNLTWWPPEPDLEPDVSMQESLLPVEIEKSNYNVDSSGF